MILTRRRFLQSIGATGAVVVAAPTARAVSLNEEEAASVRVSEDGSGNIVLDCATGEVFGPTSALLGTLNPIHIHQVKFEVVDRQDKNGVVRNPESWETGFKDTVIAYPGEITRVKARYDLPGFYVWHCHIVEHQDNEMMRPFHVGPIPPDAPVQ